MSVLVFLIPIALILGLVGLAAFIWSIRSGQYDDLEGASMRILFDDDVPKAAKSEKKSEKSQKNTQD
ncbi:MAG: cbb3-type cytochrome oxidase assembly protein CcoS [Alphaproteobacteria bacterium]|nr:cbb3-type cytochrome oxidase assembly protein CcoS [Alphaproteobacteria bacterium]MCB9975160.1 cbb3-type cytochrome oxidase assembly protein CcoS [Rhodospirillales bacterium]